MNARGSEKKLSESAPERSWRRERGQLLNAHAPCGVPQRRPADHGGWLATSGYNQADVTTAGGSLSLVSLGGDLFAAPRLARDQE